MGLFNWLSGKKKASYDLRADLLDKLAVYAEAMQFLATCGPFDASKFASLDNILSRAGVSFGAEKRQEMLADARSLLPTKTTGGAEELRVTLAGGLSQGFQAFVETLAKLSPTPETAREVKRVLARYPVP